MANLYSFDTAAHYERGQMSGSAKYCCNEMLNGIYININSQFEIFRFNFFWFCWSLEAANLMGPCSEQNNGEMFVCGLYNLSLSLCKAKVKVKVHTVDIAPLRSESPPQKRSGMAHVLKGFHSFTCKVHTHSFIRNRNEPYLPLPSQPQLVLVYRPGGMEG